MKTRSDHTTPILEGPAEVKSDLTAILYLLQSNLDKFKEEVDNSYDLYSKLGVLTELSKGIKSMIENPLKTVLQASDSIDTKMRHVINALIVSYFNHKKSSIVAAYKNKDTGANRLHYSIVLAEDNTETRLDFMEFFDKYSSLGLEDRYPVLFQFVPENLISKIQTAEKIV